MFTLDPEKHVVVEYLTGAIGIIKEDLGGGRYSSKISSINRAAIEQQKICQEQLVAAQFWYLAKQIPIPRRC